MRAIYISNGMVTKPITEFEDNSFDLSAKGHRCFYCGEFLNDPAVAWNGFAENGKSLFIHAECVYKLLPGLTRDANEIIYANHPSSKHLGQNLEP